MRVALIDPSLFTFPYDAALAGALQGLGCDVTLYGRRPRTCDGNVSAINVAAHFYPVSENTWPRALPAPLRLTIKGIDHAASMLRLWRRLNRTRPDIIHFQWLPLPVLDGRLIRLFRDIGPLVLTIHDTNPFNGNPAARLQSFGTCTAMRSFDRLIVHTRQGQARLLEQGAPCDRIDIIPHGRLVAPPPPPPDPMVGPITLLLFGKIKPYKGADILINAYAALPSALRAQARVRIIGEPFMDLTTLHTQVQQNGLSDHISIEPGHIPEDEINTLFCQGTIAVFPYREIEASGVLYQAVANGRPVIASQLGAFADILRNGKHGRLVPPCNVAALSTAIAELLENRQAASACADAVRLLQAEVPSWEEVARRTYVAYEHASSDPRHRQVQTRRKLELAA
jgi:glycosyltransferase involved in cell wall biosynthesis